MLRINFDGYNGLLRPGTVAYYVPRAERYGWMAREDIAALAARVLADPARWGGRTFPLSAQAVSLEDMARDAEEGDGVCGRGEGVGGKGVCGHGGEGAGL